MLFIISYLIVFLFILAWLWLTFKKPKIDNKSKNKLPNISCNTNKVAEKQISNLLENDVGFNLLDVDDTIGKEIFKVLKLKRNINSESGLLSIIYYAIYNKLYHVNDIRQKLLQRIDNNCDMDSEHKAYYKKNLSPLSKRHLDKNELAIFFKMLKVNAFIYIPINNLNEYNVMSLNFSKNNYNNVFLLSNEFESHYDILVHTESHMEQICIIFNNENMQQILKDLLNPTSIDSLDDINACASLGRYIAEHKQLNTYVAI